MTIPAKALLALSLATLPAWVEEEQANQDFLLFIAEFADEKGQWQAPELDDDSPMPAPTQQQEPEQ